MSTQTVDANGAIHSDTTGQFTGRLLVESDPDGVLPAAGPPVLDERERVLISRFCGRFDEDEFGEDDVVELAAGMATQMLECYWEGHDGVSPTGPRLRVRAGDRLYRLSPAAEDYLCRGMGEEPPLVLAGEPDDSTIDANVDTDDDANYFPDVCARWDADEDDEPEYDYECPTCGEGHDGSSGTERCEDCQNRHDAGDDDDDDEDD